MAKFKVGDKIKPLEDEGLGYHSYILPSEVYTVTRVHSLWSDLIDIAGLASAQAIETSATRWDKSWSEDWFELYEEKETEMNAEQIRDEILRIEARIEESKKDIENAENERNSLVEKLREKGFELLEESISQTSLEIGDTVKVVGYSETHHEHSYIGYVGTVHDTDNTDRPYKVYLEQTGYTHWFTKDEVKKI